MTIPIVAGGCTQAIGNGGRQNPLWRVAGEILQQHIIMRFRAPDSDSAIRQAHARGMRVETCEPMQTRK